MMLTNAQQALLSNLSYTQKCSIKAEWSFEKGIDKFFDETHTNTIDLHF